MAGSYISKPRQKLIEVLKPFKGLAAEVGVQEGLFSRHLLMNLPIEKLYMIDAWRFYESGYDDSANVSDDRHALNLMTAHQNTNEFKERRTIIVEESLKACCLFQDTEFDWVYLDAAHDKESVLKDLRNWRHFIRKGGIICGDDFLDGRTPYALFGVKSAVEKFAKENSLEINVFESDGEMSQWWIQL